MNYFDPVRTPLSGTNLVEASAGTGKTYAIASIYLRLLIEERLTVREILVVTFTNAAKEELKERIRTRIKDGLAAFSGGKTDDPFLLGLLRTMADADGARRLLTLALRSFDEAAIFTIHGFCLRVLRDYAFESGSLFDTELAEDQGKIFSAIFDDFWRIHFYPASQPFLNYALARLNPARLSRFAAVCMGNPFLAIDADEEAHGTSNTGASGAFANKSGGEEKKRADLALAERESRGLFEAAAKAWEESREEIISALLFVNMKAKKKFRSRKPLDRLIEDLDAYFTAGYPLPLPDKYDLLCAGGSDQPFFTLCGKLGEASSRLRECYDRLIVDVSHAAARYGRVEGDKMKSERNVRSFDDLLFDLFLALQGDGGAMLASSISRKYCALLVDEFQDTDPIQYEIFRSVYGRGDFTFFLIGDPKQSIYSFRGADIFAYIRAAKDAGKHYTLGYNRRSSGRLIEAVNTIFGKARAPFVFDPLPFYPVEPGSLPGSPDLTIDGKTDPAPFKLWFMERGPEKKNIPMGEARDLLYRAVSGEVVRLLNLGAQGRALVGQRPLVPGDIAILVRTNREARDMQRALKGRGVPGVIYSNESIFSSEEAGSVGRILEAVANPADEGKVKAALVTDIMGVTGDGLVRMVEAETGWDATLERFEGYRQQWLDQGFITMARAFMSRERTKQHLLTFQDGERRVTNLLHCIELLHNASVRNKLDIDGLLEWFKGKREEKAASDAEEYEIRLETDEMAAKVVTVHRSKGLEYPVVFSPFGWVRSETDRDDFITYHDAEFGYRPTIAVSPYRDGRARSLADTEQLAENVRLLYVALTRAKYRCYLAWGYVNRSETSPLAYLFHQGDGSPGKSILESLAARISGLTDGQMKTELQALVQSSEGSMELLPVPEPGDARFTPNDSETGEGACREFSGRIRRDWRVSSFTALVSGRSGTDDLPDRDREYAKPLPLPDTERSAAAFRTILDFPRGAQPGSCLHEIFEEADFSLADREALLEGVRGKLLRYGFDEAWAGPVGTMVSHVLSVPLIEGEPFTLSCLSPSERLHEMEFYYPLKLITSKKLARILAAHTGTRDTAMGEIAYERLGFAPVRGMLKGYVDLVFLHQGRYYILDWKSNFLGPSRDAYNPTRLRQVMEQEQYTLQYLLYAVALHKFLSYRVPGYRYETHFGGVFYMFLRGIEPDLGPEYGVFADRPPEDLIAELSHYLTGA
jgi:exodeoxyribonuclease V beta subunit